jgi:hypothetical protein
VNHVVPIVGCSGRGAPVQHLVVVNENADMGCPPLVGRRNERQGRRFWTMDDLAELGVAIGGGDPAFDDACGTCADRTTSPERMRHGRAPALSRSSLVVLLLAALLVRSWLVASGPNA